MSASCTRSSRPTSASSYQNSSPRLPSPLNPSLTSSSPVGHTPRNSPVGEMSDTLSPLRERLDSGLAASPRSSPTVGRPRTSSFSRSPERSPVTGPIPLQSHRAYARHPSPSGSPFAQGIALSSPSPLSSPPLAGSPQSPKSQNARPLSPCYSPASVHSTHSPSHPTPSHFHFAPSSPVQIIPSPCRYTRTQSLIQQSFGNPYGARVSSPPPDNQRNRRVSLGAEPRPEQPMPGSPTRVGRPFTQDGPPTVKGDSTPLNEAPIRWWGGRRSWVDDWDGVAQQPHAHFSGHDELDGAMGTGYGTVREHFGRGVGGPGAFLDEEIRASFDDAGGVNTGFAVSLVPGPVHAPIGTSTCHRTDGIPVPRAVPMPGGARPRIRDENPGCGDVEVGLPLIDDGFMVQKTPDSVAHCHPCHVHSHGTASGFTPDGAKLIHGQELGHGGRGRRCSDASTHSSTSYASCLSGPSQSQSLLLSSSQSHTSTCPSLGSLGIGIEEAEREGLRSKTIWRRRHSGSTLKRRSRGLSNGAGRHGEDVGQGCRCSRLVKNSDKSELVCMEGPEGHTHEKDMVRHGSSFFRVGTKHGDVADEQAQREGYKRAEKYVSLAITSILPATTITMSSPVGEALVKARDSAKYIGQEIGPVLKDTLSVSADILSLAPLPGLEEAAKALLCVWDACQKVDTNRLSCLRLAERCATLLYSVRCEINEAGVETALALAEPVEKLCGALVQIRTFLETQLHRPFLKRYVRREEITRELAACNEAITDAASRFGISVQIRTYHEVCLAVNESKRFAMEAQAMLSLDHQMIQRQYAMMCGPQVQTWQEVVTGFPRGNALGLTMDGALAGANGQDEERDGGGYRTPPLGYGPPPSTMSKVMSTGFESGSTPTSSMLSTRYYSDETDTTVSCTPTPTPTRATFVVEETRTTAETHPVFPMHALAQVHRVQDAVDTAADEAALRGTLAGALDAQNDVEMVRCLQVARGEISEAAETLRRMLGEVAEAEVGEDRNEGTASSSGANTELDRKFMQSGIEAMTRLGRGEDEAGRGEDAVAVDASELPSWTITRYEVVRTRKIGMGFFSDVYLGHWWKREVAIKVLAHTASREAFVRYIELWNTLDHPNVLPLYGASSAVGEKPWFIVSKFCSGGDLATMLKRAKAEGATRVGNGMLLKSMHEIARGMAYLHGCGVLHGDLRAANVLVDEDGQCILSDFGQCEIKSEAHRLCGQPETHLIRWWAPEVLMGNDRPTCAADVYAFAMCCVEILGMGDLFWGTLDEKTVRELVLDKDERPPIPMLAGCADIAKVVTNVVQSCWVREPDRRPTFSTIACSLENAWKVHSRIDRVWTPGSAPVPSAASSPADEQYETASESMTTSMEEEGMDYMTNVPLTSPGPVFGMVRLTASDDVDTSTPTLSLTNTTEVERTDEEHYRLVMKSNHAFHSSLTLALWSPTRVEVGAVGYLSKPKGEFITLFNAMDPLQSGEEQLRRLPSMYGYGKFEVQKREDGKRSVAQRGLDALSGFLTFKSRTDRSRPERIARQYAFPLVQGKPCAQLCVERTVHRCMDRLEAPKMWFEQHVDVILKVLGPRYGILKEDLILVVGTLDALDWAVFVSGDHCDGRAQFHVFSGREKGEPWGMYTIERAAKSGNAGPGRWVDVDQGTISSKVSCGGLVDVGDTVMLAGLRFERGTLSVM